MSQYYSDFSSALSLWSSNGFDIAAIFTNEFDVWELIDDESPYDFHPNHVLDEDGGRANKYILHYAAKVADFASAMAGSGLKTLWIWNEPDLHNNFQPGQYSSSAGDLAPEVFRGNALPDSEGHQGSNSERNDLCRLPRSAAQSDTLASPDRESRSLSR